MSSVCAGESSARYGNHDRRHPDQWLSAGGRHHHRPGRGGTNRNADQRVAAAASSEGAQSQGKIIVYFKIKAASSPGDIYMWTPEHRSDVCNMILTPCLLMC